MTVLKDAMAPHDLERLRRKVARFGKAGLFDVDRSNIVIERAVSVEALKRSYSLVHDVYCEKGYIREQKSKVRMRVFEALPEMATFVGRHDGRIVAVTSVVVDSPDLGLPSDHVYGEDIARLRAYPGSVCEITNLAIDREHRDSPAFLALTQACLAHAMAMGCGNMFIAISPGHARFFRDILQFEFWGGRRRYSDEVEDYVEGMRFDINNGPQLARRFDRCVGHKQAFLHDFYYTGNPFHGYVRTWQAQAEATFRNPQMLRDLFLFCTELLYDASDHSLDAIEQHWGDSIFWNVWGEPGGPARAFGAPVRSA